MAKPMGTSLAEFGKPAAVMHAPASAYPDSPGASPSLLEVPSSAYELNGECERAASTDVGGGGLPTLGVVTVVLGPLGAAAVHAARPAQQARIPIAMRMRILVPFGDAPARRCVAPPAGWCGRHAGPGMRRPGTRQRCRSAAQAGSRQGSAPQSSP